MFKDLSPEILFGLGNNFSNIHYFSQSLQNHLKITSWSGFNQKSENIEETRIGATIRTFCSQSQLAGECSATIASSHYVSTQINLL